MNLEESFDTAITAVRRAGQYQLGAASPNRSDLSDWGWAFTELTATLRFVCHELSSQIGQHADRTSVASDDGAASTPQFDSLCASLVHLESTLAQAASHARAVAATFDLGLDEEDRVATVDSAE